MSAPNFERSRAVLQDKLWSDRAPEQGAGSLRQALTEIRKAFEDEEVLTADRRFVRLERAAIKADVLDPAAIEAAQKSGAVFLEGLDVRDPEFEDWLRDRRLALESQPVVRVPTPPVLRSIDDRPPRLVLSPTTGSNAVFAEYVAQSIATGVSNVGAVDLRWQPDDLGGDEGRHTYRLETSERSLSGGTILYIKLLTYPGNTICWQTSEILTGGDLGNANSALARLINHGVDRTTAAFAGDRLFDKMNGEGELFFTIREMWTSGGRNANALSAKLEEHFASEGRGVHLAWRAFSTCFVIGERRASVDALEIQDLIRRAIELEPHNPLVLALASHVYGFVLRRYEVAHDLAERSVSLDANNALGWAFLGVAKINLGLFDEAFPAVVHARKIAAEGPNRPFIDSVAAMIASLTGHGREAMRLGESVHAVRPNFAPPLRYLLANYLAAGDMARARVTAARLREIEPDFEIAHFAEPEYPTEPLRRSGLLDFRNLPDLA